MICAAKPRYAAASAREHLRVLTPRLFAPSTQVTSSFHKPGEIDLEMSQRLVLLARIKGKEREVQACRFVTQVQAVCSHFSASRTPSSPHADADE